MNYRFKFPWLRRHAVSVFFVVAFLFMSMLVMEQGRTIENQKALIRQLSSDSMELSAARAHHAPQHGQ